MANIAYDFKGKVALVTGSSSGIGAATAILFAKSGANVVVTGRNAIKLMEVAKQCQQISPNNCKPLQVLADVTKEEDLKRLVESTIKEFGKLDILVNNAGYADVRPITNPEYMSGFENILQTNLKSAVYLTHICVEHLAKTKGNIINISSIASHRSVINNSSAYCMSKSAMDMFTKCMAAELGPKGIRVNSVNPGAVRTAGIEKLGMDKSVSDALYDAIGKMYPVGRVGEPQEIANSILYLASDEASFITGTIMVVDGGDMAAGVNINMLV